MFDPQAILAEAVTEPAPQEQPVENAQEQTEQAPSEEAQVTENEDVSNKPDSELTPEQLAKREANRQSHLNRKLAKQRLREENRELKARLEKLEQSFQPKQNTQNTPNDYPKEENYESMLDFIKAVAKYEAKQGFNAEKTQSAEKQIDMSKAQRLQELAAKEQEFAKQTPDYERVVYQENSYIMNNMPRHVGEALLECDNASMALYALAKEGRLEDLEDLEGRALDRALAQAEERGKSYISQQKRISSAPPPIESLRGTGRTAKHDNELSVKELLAKYNK